MTTYLAKQIIGSNAAANPAGALLQSGVNRADDSATGDTWIFLNTVNSATNPWGIFHSQVDNKIKIIGDGTDDFWVDMDTGDTYILGKVGIGYNPETSGNTYKLYVNGTTCLTDNLIFQVSNGGGIYYKGTYNTYRMIRFIDATDEYGNGISIGGGGLTVLGSGESSDTILSNLNLTSSGGTETTYICSDSNIEFYPTQQSYNAGYKISMYNNRLWVGVDGDTSSEGQLGVRSAGGSIYLWSSSSTTGDRGLYVPSHGTGSAKDIIRINTNNVVTYAGGTFNDSISFTNSGTAFRGINYGTMGDNDQWRIGGAATAANAGYMELATADDGNEPIYVRQYTGAFSTLTRTLTLLDANGDTNFPGQIYRTGKAVSWYQGRSAAMIKTTSYTGYDAILSMKTTAGDWSLGVYTDNICYLTYILDSNFSANTNAITRQFYFKPDGTIGGSSFTGNAATATKLSNTPNNTTTFLRGDNTWTNTINNTIICIPPTSNMAASNMAFNGGIQVRESGGVGNGQSAIEYGPRISFHWSNRIAKSITLHSNGTFYFRDQNGTTRSTIDANVVGNVTGNCSGSSGSCTGNAATASSVAWTGVSGRPTIDKTTVIYQISRGANFDPIQSGYFAGMSTSTGITSDWWHILSMDWSGNDAGNWISQLALPTQNRTGVYYRSRHSSSTYAWKKLWTSGESITNAVWNDYAEYRESDCDEFGYVLMEKGDDTLTKTTERLSHFAGISSNTWGFAQGETEKAKTPIAVAGRVLVYPYKDRQLYKPGDVLCAAPGGTVDIMTREEIIKYPDRIVGIVSCVPEYKEWGGSNLEIENRPPILVDGRIWIKVK